MALTLQREPTAYRSLLTLTAAVLAEPEPMPARLVRGCIALAITACVLTVACNHRLADSIQGGELSIPAYSSLQAQLHSTSDGTLASRGQCVALLTQYGFDGG